MRVLLSGLCAVSAILLSSCATHSVDVSPAPAIAAEGFFSTDIAGNFENDYTDERLATPWWESLNRPALNDLVEQAFQENQDIAQAVARVAAARAVTARTRAGALPEVDLQGQWQKSRRGSRTQDSSYNAGAGFSWEVDLFNRIGAAAQADSYQELARTEDLNALKLVLSAEVATAYFGAVGARKRLDLLNSQLRTDNDLLDLIKLRQESGIGTNVEVLQQQSRVAESLSLIPPAEAERRIFENRLDVLLGQVPDGQDRVPPEESLQFTAVLPKIGVPAALLVNRPDLRAAQAELVAADSSIAVAIADRLPQVTLGGTYLYSNTDVFSGPLAMVMAAFVQPLLDWGRRKAEVERNKALYSEKLAAYTQLFLLAVEEVENTLYQEDRQREYIARLEERRHILQNTVDEAEALFTQGVNDYLPVLNALQELRALERNLVNERLNLIDFRISLHRAIGGLTQIDAYEER